MTWRMGVPNAQAIAERMADNTVYEVADTCQENWSWRDLSLPNPYSLIPTP